MESKEQEQFNEVISVVKKDGEKINAPKNALLSVFNKIAVTENLNARYNYKKQEEGSRPSLLVEYINQFNLFMSKQSYLVAAVVLALVAAGGVYWYSQNPAVAPGTDFVPATKQVEKVTSEAVAVEVADELTALDQDIADINDLNAASNEAELDALSKDLAAINSI